MSLKRTAPPQLASLGVYPIVYPLRSVFLILVHNSMSSHPAHVTHHFRFLSNFYQWLALVWVYKIHIFSLIQFLLLNLWPIKDGPCRPLPSVQKLNFRLAAFCKKCDILRRLCQMKLKICSLLNFRVLNQNMMVKRDEYKWKLCYFDVSFTFRISENCREWLITNGFLRMWHSW